MAMPGGESQPFCEAVTTASRSPVVHAHFDRAERGDGVDDDERVGDLADGGGDVGDGVGDAGGGLVVGDEQGVVVVLLDEVGDEFGGGGVAPLDVGAGDLGAVALGDGGEAVAEGADGHAERLVADGEGVDDGGFHGAGAGGGDDQDFLVGAEEGLDAGGDAFEELGELGPAVVDHFACGGGKDVWRAGGGTRNAQIRGHGEGGPFSTMSGDCANRISG